MNGILLGFENYIPKFKSGEEGLVVNTSSTAALGIMPFFPIYTGTKMAVLGISRSLADAEHYARTKVKVIILCPGATDTQLLQDCAKGAFTPAYQEMMERRHNPPSQRWVASRKIQCKHERPSNFSPLRVARGLVEIIGQADHGSVWVVAVGRKPYEVELPEQIGKIKQHGKLDPNVFWLSLLFMFLVHRSEFLLVRLIRSDESWELCFACSAFINNHGFSIQL